MSCSKMWSEPLEEEHKQDELDNEHGRKNREGDVREIRDDRDVSDANRKQTRHPRYVSAHSSTNKAKVQASNFNRLDDVCVQVHGRNSPKPLRNTLLGAGMSLDVLVNVSKSECTHPMPIQRYAIPIVLAGRDLMACVQTGTGKEAAFVLPLINRLLSQDILVDGTPNPYILIVVPVKQHAQHINTVARKIIRGTPLRLVVIFGGVSMGYQQGLLDKGCHVMVATLDRLSQFLSRGSISLRNVKYLVLDEVDRMLNLGFQPAIDQLMSLLPMRPKEARQTLMFSATFPRTIRELAAKLLDDPISVFVGIVGSVTNNFKQVIYEVNEQQKRAKLEEILREGDPSGTLIFVEMKRNLECLAAVLKEAHFTTVSIHGNRPQHKREEAISDFGNGRKDVLIVTSMVARDLDIRRVRHVINYDMPKLIGEYVRRIGCTGRVGSNGRATSFYDPCADLHMAGHLVQVLTETGQPVPNFLPAAASRLPGWWAGFSQPENLFAPLQPCLEEP